MSSSADGSQPPTLAPDDAFRALGDEKRVRILQTLGSVDGALSFTELRDRIGLDRGQQFNYHLKQLVGHFVEKTDDGYDLRVPGRRVVKAVLSGAVAEPPVVEQTEIDEMCQLCGASIEVGYRRAAVESFCTRCSGMWDSPDTNKSGYLGRRVLPAAGVKGREPAEIYRTAWRWMNLDFFAIASGHCPSCSAKLDTNPDVCREHEPDEGRCGACGDRYAAALNVRCTNCILDMRVSLPVALLANTELLEFLTDHGLNPVAPDSIAPVQRFFSDYEEEIQSADPLLAVLTFSAEGDSITVTIDEDLSIIDVTKNV